MLNLTPQAIEGMKVAELRDALTAVELPLDAHASRATPSRLRHFDSTMSGRMLVRQNTKTARTWASDYVPDDPDDQENDSPNLDRPSAMASGMEGGWRGRRTSRRRSSSCAARGRSR